MKKKIKNISCVALSFLLVFGVCFFNGSPSKAVAKNLEFTFTLSEEARGVLGIGAYNGDTKMDTNVAGNVIRILAPNHNDNDNPFLFFLTPEYASGDQNVDQEKYSAICSSEYSCKIIIQGDFPEDVGFRFPRSGDAGFDIKYADGSDYFSTAGNLSESEDFLIVPRVFGPEFKGQAYLFWACGEERDETCYHYFDDLRATTDNIDQSVYDYQFYAGSEISDDRTGQYKFDLFGNGTDIDWKRGFVQPDRIKEWLIEYGNKVLHEDWGSRSLDQLFSSVDFSKIDVELILKGNARQLDMGAIEADLISREICNGEAEREVIEACVDNWVAQEMGQENQDKLYGVKIQDLTGSDKGTYTSFGDHQFKVIIYSDGYKAGEVVDFSELEFIPYQFGSSPVALNGSSENDPAILEMPLLDDTISFSALKVDEKSVNSFGISAIEAMNVPSGAVSVEKTNDRFQITFHSNFYDSVLFKVTGSDGESYYLRIKRTTFLEMAVDHANTFNNNFTGLRVEFYYSEGTSYSDYDLTATIVYRDGREEIVPLKNLGWVDSNHGGNLKFGKEYDGNNDKEGDDSGKNLKRANYGIEFSDLNFEEDIDKVYYNVRFTGGSEKDYQGTFAGSGRGFEHKIEHFRGLGEE